MTEFCAGTIAIIKNNSMNSYKFKQRILNLPSNPQLKQRARELRRQGVLSEVLFWNEVKQKRILDLDFDRQKIIGNYIVDFYIKKLGIVIEIDGISHNEKIEEDEIRDNYLKGLGLVVIRYSDLDIEHNLDNVIQDLKNQIIKKTMKSSLVCFTPCSMNIDFLSNILIKN